MDNVKSKYNVDEMLKTFSEDENLRQFLKKYEIAVPTDFISKKYCHKDDKRCIVITDAREENFSHSTRIMIDLKLGSPTVNQVYEALYDIGKDCDIKIICFTNDSNDIDDGIPVADEYLVAGIIGEMQNHNVPILLFSIDHDTLKEKYIEYYQNWHAVNRLKDYRLPSKEKFMEDTFWGVYFDSYNFTFYEPWNAFKGCYNENGNNNYIIYIDSIFYGEIRLLWDENGVRFEAKQITESEEFMKKVLDVIMQDLKNKYGDDSVEFENVVGRLPRLYIKFSDKPFNWLFTATPRQITEFAEKMYHDAWGLRWMIEGTIEKLYEKVPA
ncbi:hypothetical protein [uncultured Desulfosarcina sp.]|uniref:hypothetical protein n=1 Tax=uncultured Desulfosarcina sp. TaxID=218289 RepID=UPI0029C7AA85|nr:hypothetical protein [uncultured Desulfosarcina sp.]